MEPVAVAGLVMIGAALVTAIAIGSVGGAVTAGLQIPLAWGAALTVAGGYLADWRGSWRSLLFRLAPLLLTFLVASLSGRRLRARIGPLLATLAALGGALAAGFLYLTLFRIFVLRL